MNPAELTERITIEKKAETKDSIGTRQEVWTEFKKVWASVKDLFGREYFAAQQVNSEISVKVKIRYVEGIKSTMRIIAGDRVLEIKSPPIRDKRKGEIILMCREKVD